MKKYSRKDILLILIILISQLHILFRGIDCKVDWFLFSEKTRGLNFSVFMVGVYVRFIIVHYCLFNPTSLSKKLALFLLILSGYDLLHFFLTSGLGYAKLKLFISYLTYEFTRRYV